MSYYKGYVSQHGNGLGNVLSGIVRAVIPIASKTLKGAAKAAGKSILKNGLQGLENMDHGSHPLQTAFSFAPTTKRRRRTKVSRRITKHGRKITNRKRGRRNQRGAGKRKKKTNCKRRLSKPRKKCRKRGYKRKRNPNTLSSSRNKRRRRGVNKGFDIFSSS